MKKLLRYTGIVVLLAALIAGCKPNTATPVAKYDGAKFILPTEPEGAKGVISVRESSKNADKVIIVGRIGGSVNPWVEGRAAFSIVDPSLLACSDEKQEGEACSCNTPWDYCCLTDKLPAASALVKFVEPDGSVVKHDVREVFELKELQTVVITGTAERDEAGNLTVLADGMFVRK